jgi:hypothetical protein
VDAAVSASLATAFNDADKRVTPNLSVNTDAPFAWLRPRTGSPVTVVR